MICVKYGSAYDYSFHLNVILYVNKILLLLQGTYVSSINHKVTWPLSIQESCI